MDRRARVALFVGLGVYGIVSFSVANRTTELGVRMAVGAQPSTILGLVRQGLRMAIISVVVGVMLLASFVPARRASRVSPMAALRYE